MTKNTYVALITGAASGIGRATALCFAQEGSAVIVSDRSIVEGEKVVEEIKKSGGRAAFVGIDVASEESVQEALKKALTFFGRIDVAVHSAGIGGPQLLAHEFPQEDWQKVMNVDLNGAFYFGKAMISYWLTQEPRQLRNDTDLGLEPVMQRGALAMVASIAGHFAISHMGAYAAAKHGVNGIAKTFAFENAEKGIRVNTVCPGCIYTPIMHTPVFDFNVVKDEIIKEQAMQRFGHPDEVASALYFLCSDEASFCTGTELRIDAGWGAH